MTKLRDTVTILASGGVERYHTEPGPNSQDNAAHCWGVETLIWCLHPSPSKELLRAAHFHDVGELVGGDVPFPAKKRSPQLRALHHDLENQVASEMGVKPFNLTATEAAWLRYCDMLEAAHFSWVTWHRYGSMRYRDIALRALRALEEDIPLPETESEDLTEFTQYLRTVVKGDEYE